MAKCNMRCADCGKDVRDNPKDYYMVTDDLWKKYGVGRKLLCMGCLEKRIGRKLTADDFTDCILNEYINPYTKQLLANRNNELEHNITI